MNKPKDGGECLGYLLKVTDMERITLADATTIGRTLNDSYFGAISASVPDVLIRSRLEINSELGKAVAVASADPNRALEYLENLQTAGKSDTAAIVQRIATTRAGLSSNTGEALAWASRIENPEHRALAMSEIFDFSRGNSQLRALHATMSDANLFSNREIVNCAAEFFKGEGLSGEDLGLLQQIEAMAAQNSAMSTVWQRIQASHQSK